MDPLDRPESPGPRQDALPGGQIELTMPPDDDSAPGTVPPAPRRYAALAWGVIIVLCSVMVLIHQGRQEAPAPGESDEDTLGLMLMEMQAKYIIYTAHLQGGGDLLYQSAAQIDTGTIGQRLRFVVLAGELKGPEEGIRRLDQLDDLIREQRGESGAAPFEMTPEQLRLQGILRALYHDEEQSADTEQGEAASGDVLPRPDRIDADDRTFLVDQLGWFGELALAPAGMSDQAAREKVLEPAHRIFAVLLGAMIGLCVVGFCGFVGLVLCAVLIATGRLRSRLQVSGSQHGIYAETFALWLLVFLLFQLFAGVVGAVWPDLLLPSAFVGFFLSLSALYWPSVRGISWAVARHDIGWTWGPTPAREPLFGIAGYAMGLPLLAVGVGITLVFVLLQQATSGAGPTFGPSGGPAHPIVEQLGGPAWAPKVMVLLLAAVAAPIVEETMFRGVLYRHLRDATRSLGLLLSILVSATVNAFVFAVIHPQGWVAIPALMSLAYAFTLMREWRGSVIPSMIMHAVSNGLVMTLLILALSGS